MPNMLWKKKTLLMIALPAFVTLLLIGIVWMSFKPQPTLPPGNNSTSLTEASSYFAEKMEEGFTVTGVRPIEGFEPMMFMGVFPGLKASDFEGVQAFEGHYQTAGDQVRFVPRMSRTTTSAAQSITREGMGTLLENVARRLNRPLATKADIDVILQELRKSPASKPPENVVPNRKLLEGVYLCLPHRDTSGPQTMECAFGLQTDDGTYYALSFNVLESMEVVNQIAVGDRIRVEGLVTPIEMISSDMWRIYPVKGIMSATTLELVSKKS